MEQAINGSLPSEKIVLEEAEVISKDYFLPLG